MMIRNIALCILCTCVLTCCRNKEREQELEKRETVLLEKEKQFALKETEYVALVKMRDSLLTQQKKDTENTRNRLVVTWPVTLAGMWLGRLVCTESTCSDHVVGDQRLDTWELSSDSAQLVAKIVNNNKLLRVYTARYDNDIIRLHYKSDSTAAKLVEMNVLLNEIDSNKIKGSRTVTIDNKCLAKFSVELTRIAK